MSEPEPATDDAAQGGEQDTLSGTFQKAPAIIDARLVEEETEVETREGTLKAYPGDVLITGVEGEVYPCDPLVFAKTYVPAGADDLDLFREVVPDGVNVYFENVSGQVVPSGISIEEGEVEDLSDEEVEEAVEFVLEYVEAMPTIRGDPEDIVENEF